VRRLTFSAWRVVTSELPGLARAGWFSYLTAEEQASCWDDLAERTRLWNESSWRAEKRLYEEWPRPKRHQPAQRSSAATSTRPGTVVLSSGDDPLKAVPPHVYIAALTGEVPSAKGWMHCPFGDHEDRTPSFQVLSSHWRCFGCQRGGSAIDFGAAWYGIEPRGRGYWEIRDRLVAELEGVVDG
jgi:hypothetical protein